MKALLRTLLVTLALALPITLAAAPAHAADPYVTKSEFSKVTKGKPISKVHRIFDVKGKQTYYSSAISGSTYCHGRVKWGCANQTREYKTKSSWGLVTVDYYRMNGVWRVSSKWAYWG